MSKATGAQNMPPTLHIPQQSPSIMSPPTRFDQFSPTSQSGPSNYSNHSLITSPRAGPSRSSTHSSIGIAPNHGHSTESQIPIAPLPDSLLLRATFSSLEHGATTLKRLSKSVQASTAAVLSLMDQLDRAEDELYSGLGELGRYLEAGYGVSGEIWDERVGIRNVGKERRRREREELEGMVDHGLRGVRQELKRQGLAGGPAHSKFEQTAKQYYNQTSAYLTPQSATTSTFSPNPQSHIMSASATSSSRQSTSSSNADLGQASRTAQFDLARYNHHSTLLYSVPPSSVGCLDLLVGLYGWAGTILGERARGSLEAEGDATPILYDKDRTRTPAISPIDNLKASLSTSLSHLSETRAELLKSWSVRDQQTTLLEEECAQRQAEADGSWVEIPFQARHAPTPLSPVSTDDTPIPSPYPAQGVPQGIENLKKKSHKPHRSVGGRLRDMLSSSSSSRNLHDLDRLGSRSSPHERPSSGRMSLDGYNPRMSQSNNRLSTKDMDKLIVGGISLVKKGSMPDMKIGVPTSTSRSSPPPLPEKTSAITRPDLTSRHSIQITRDSDEYQSPYNAFADYPPSPLLDDLSVDVEKSLKGYSGTSILPVVIESPVKKVVGAGQVSMGQSGGVGGVGGISGTGDEDEKREEVGRKKEGVLWGSGNWEGLSKSGNKGKWEKFWVVLEQSRIYEYRDSGLGKPESAFAVIDLKFASVREGRGTDRRFVFEIVTPSQGRRLYQATSESEMKLWLYAVCNAIESCINGTSSVRTFDTSKLRTISGSLDDHALPTRSKLVGLGLPIPRRHHTSNASPPGIPINSKTPQTPTAIHHLGIGAANRRSMPPPAKGDMFDRGDDDGRFGGLMRSRKTSFKKVLKQSAEAAGERWSSVVQGVSTRNNTNNNNGGNGGLDIPRPFGQSRSTSRSSLTASASVSASDGRVTPTSSILPSGSGVNKLSASPSSSNRTREGRSSWFEESVDGDIEKRVLEMAGVGMGHPKEQDSEKRRFHSEALGRLYGGPAVGGEGAVEMIRSKSAETGGSLAKLAIDGGTSGVEAVDMKMLRRIAELPGNSRCADCGKGMKSSRWATLSLRGFPMVIFICIRCCGLHRGLGTHISKPRSVDLDIWSQESILLAREWGNERSNSIWEARKPSGIATSDQHMPEFIRTKYVEGRWVSPDYRTKFGLSV